MPNQRNRGVYLDPIKVKQIAGRQQISSSAQLTWHYYKHHGIGEQNDYTAEKAWSGKKIEIKKAQMLAEALGLDSYDRLLSNSISKSSWELLINNENYHESFFELVDDSESDLRLVNFGTASGRGNLDRISLDTPWRLKLRGAKGDSLFILLRSEHRFFQLAPIERAGYSSIFESRSLSYPKDDSIHFSQNDGVGWRELIAIRANRIPIGVRGDDTGYDCTLEELDLFARRLQEIKENKIAIARYMFMLAQPCSTDG